VNTLGLGLVKRLLSPIPLIVLAGVLALVALLGYGLASNKTKESSTSTLLNKVAPTPDLEKALEAPTREKIQQSSDEAAFARRAMATC